MKKPQNLGWLLSYAARVLDVFRRKTVWSRKFDIDDHGNDASVSDDPLHQLSNGYQVKIMKLEIDYREPLFLQVIGGFSGDRDRPDILDLNKNTVMTTRLFRLEISRWRDAGYRRSRGQHNGWFRISLIRVLSEPLNSVHEYCWCNRKWQTQQ